MKKKITAGFLTALLILGLCSCGGKTGEETKPVQEAESTALSGLTVKPASDEAPVPEETPEPEKTPEPTAEPTPEPTPEPSPEPAPGADPRAERVGVYRAIEVQFEGQEVTTTEQLDLYEELGMKLRLRLHEDGTAEMDIMGEIVTMKWDMDGLTSDDSDKVLPYTWEDGILTMKQDGEYMIFRKMTEEEVAADEASAEAQEDKEPLAPGEYDPSTRAGYYELSTTEKDGTVSDAGAIAALGMKCYLVMNEDYTGYMYLFGFKLNFTWAEDDDNFMVFGAPMAYTYDSGSISLEYEGSKMNFAYVGKAAEAPAEDEE